MQQRTAPAGQRRRYVAVDGKTLRGSGGADPARHLLAAIDHDHGVVLGQVDVGAKTGESPRLPALLDTLELAGAVVTPTPRTPSGPPPPPFTPGARTTC